MFRLPVLAVATLAALTLAGCVPSGSVRPAEVAAPEAEVDCLLGPWTLDLVDYAAQAEPMLNGIGIPISGLTYTGSYRIEFTDTGDGLYFSLNSQLTSSAIVNGVPITGSESTIAFAEAVWANEAHDAVIIELWSDIEPREVEGSLPPLDILAAGDGEVRFACSGDTLSLAGPGAPLIGLFIRQ